MAVGQDKVRTLITLTKENKEKLEELAKEDGRSLSSYISNILQAHIEKEEVMQSLAVSTEEPLEYNDLDRNTFIENKVKETIEEMIKVKVNDYIEKHISDIFIEVMLKKD